jgi:hypothetical protein
MAFQKLGSTWMPLITSGRIWSKVHPAEAQQRQRLFFYHIIEPRVFLKAPMCRSCGRRPASSAPSSSFWS